MLDIVTGLRHAAGRLPAEAELAFGRLVAAGAVDGMTRSNTAMVDGHSLEVNARMLARLRAIVECHRDTPGAP